MKSLCLISCSALLFVISCGALRKHHDDEKYGNLYDIIGYDSYYNDYYYGDLLMYDRDSNVNFNELWFNDLKWDKVDEFDVFGTSQSLKRKCIGHKQQICLCQFQGDHHQYECHLDLKSNNLKKKRPVYNADKGVDNIFSYYDNYYANDNAQYMMMMNIEDLHTAKAKSEADAALAKVETNSGNRHIMTLVHATTKAGYEGIALGHGTMHAGKGGLMGPAIYLAFDAKQAVAKALAVGKKDKKGKSLTYPYLIVMRVLVGQPHVVEPTNYMMSGKIWWSNGITPFKKITDSILMQSQLFLKKENVDSVYLSDTTESYKGHASAGGPELIIFKEYQIYVTAKHVIAEL